MQRSMATAVERGGLRPLLEDSTIAFHEGPRTLPKRALAQCWNERQRMHPLYEGPKIDIQSRATIDAHWKAASRQFAKAQLGPKTFGVYYLAGDADAFRERVLVHELGHHMHLDGKLSRALSDEIGVAYRKRVNPTTGHLHPGKWAASEYAMRNEMEWWAETHTAYVYHPEELRAADQEAYDLVSRVRVSRGLAPGG
jgi:hypothetical protein